MESACPELQILVRREIEARHRNDVTAPAERLTQMRLDSVARDHAREYISGATDRAPFGASRIRHTSLSMTTRRTPGGDAMPLDPQARLMIERTQALNLPPVGQMTPTEARESVRQRSAALPREDV